MADIDYIRQRQQMDDWVRRQQELSQQRLEEKIRRPHVVEAYDATMNEAGIVLDVDSTLKVRIPPALFRRLETLLQMAVLAKLLPDSPSPETP